ncbi:hypothetical protein GXN76_14345 [Kroppenstedtia pulmonis]|uniref:Uncharacterized protein n=1 Tax=Kroppenstedtia pulmonis TaxID=1380685 RepID=A0A7D4BIL0_9BACL|nr:hypothetical protein [Kroppenstedtia pulmonis]QKG85515.1 hypothetical protein GXN76_14345 [Kroppenstedtia pulmonis]
MLVLWVGSILYTTASFLLVFLVSLTVMPYQGHWSGVWMEQAPFYHLSLPVFPFVFQTWVLYMTTAWALGMLMYFFSGKMKGVSSFFMTCSIVIISMISGSIQPVWNLWLPASQSIPARHDILNPSLSEFSTIHSLFYNLILILLLAGLTWKMQKREEIL